MRWIDDQLMWPERPVSRPECRMPWRNRGVAAARQMAPGDWRSWSSLIESIPFPLPWFGQWVTDQSPFPSLGPY
jgi:hypothetical protein